MGRFRLLLVGHRRTKKKYDVLYSPGIPKHTKR